MTIPVRVASVIGGCAHNATGGVYTLRAATKIAPHETSNRQNMDIITERYVVCTNVISTRSTHLSDNCHKQ